MDQPNRSGVNTIVSWYYRQQLDVDLSADQLAQMYRDLDNYFAKKQSKKTTQKQPGKRL